MISNPLFSIASGGYMQKSKGAQMHKPEPPDVAFKFGGDRAEAMAPLVFQAMRKRAYQGGCAVSVYWFLDSGSMFLMSHNHKLSDEWANCHVNAHVGSYGFVHREGKPKGQKIIRPSIDSLAGDLVEHARLWGAG